MSDIAIKTADFEGPIELLLQLIQKHKLAINDISLARVTDEFLQKIEHLPKGAHREVANFLVVAATLILIKSRSLLPKIELTDEEEADIESLEHRLALYEQVANSLPALSERWLRNPIYTRSFVPRNKITFTPDPESMQTRTLYTLLQELIADLPIEEERPRATVRPVIHIADMVNRITTHIQGGQGSFRSLTRSTQHEDQHIYRATAIVGFLALLEMARNYEITVLQSEHFGDIVFEKAV